MTSCKPKRKNPDLSGRTMKQAFKIKTCNSRSNPKGNFQIPRHKTLFLSTNSEQQCKDLSLGEERGGRVTPALSASN